MSVFLSAFGGACAAAEWQPEAVARMDQGHLVAWSDRPEAQACFAGSVHQHLGSQPATAVCPLYGRYITDLDSLCHQLERAMATGPIARTIDGRGGVVDALRTRGTAFGGLARSRYTIWHDADALLAHDPGLFAAVIDAVAGVAAEWEFVNDDLLLIDRCLLVGGPELASCAADSRGPLRSWLCDGQAEPFWRLVTGVARPPIEVARIESLTA